MHFIIRLRHPGHGVSDQYVALPDWIAAYDSVEIIDGATNRIICRIEHGQIADLASRIERLIVLLEKANGGV